MDEKGNKLHQNMLTILEQPKIEIDKFVSMKEVVISKSAEITPLHNSVQVKANK